MITEKKQNSEIQSQGKRLSLDDFKLEKLNHLEVVAAKDLGSVLGGVADPSSYFNCPLPPMDDCHS